MALTTQSLAKFGLTALSAFILTACGSSGGGNNSSAPAENPAPQVQQPAKPQQSNQPAQTVKPEQPTEAQKPVQPKTEPKPEQPTEAEKPVQPKIELKPEQPKVNTSGTGAYSFIKEIEGNVSGFEKKHPYLFFNQFQQEYD